MAIDYSVFKDVGGQPKPEPRQRTQGRKVRVSRAVTRDIRAYVFDREQSICRCCRLRPAESMHELKSRGSGGKVSKRNSIAVCGQIVGAVPSCHTYLQSNAISYTTGIYGADDVITFCPRSEAASEWLRLPIYTVLESGPTPQIRGEVEI